MSATLAPTIEDNFLCASERAKFFSEENLRRINQLEKREQIEVGKPGDSCKTNLFFGFFFDGTRNNYKSAEESRSKNHSNVARLYDCYPGEGVSQVLPSSRAWKDSSRFASFFKVYIPGVATPFAQVKDDGNGTQEKLGAAVGRYAQRRIIWALVQAINNLHRFFLKSELIKGKDLEHLLNFVELNRSARRFMSFTANLPPLGVHQSDRVARGEFEHMLRRLHKAVSPHWPDQRTGKPEKINPGIVKTIYISIFGFSRGATEARAFVNWLRSLCELDARIRGKSEGSLTLGGFNVHFDFIGLFDTVASIGSANTGGILDGHGAWADAEESLRIPVGIRCLHLVAAHELRRSFPVDSISVGESPLPFGFEEIVVPGVHSDIGGGYCPKEQGRGIDPDGNDMLSRIALLMMYKAARLSGVPLKLEDADSAAKERFALNGEVIKAFNAYIKSCKVTKGPIHQIMREQARKQMIWRIVRRISGSRSLQQTSSFLRASTFDQNDLLSAASEFESEIKTFSSWLERKGKDFRPTGQAPGFKGGYESEWEEIATWWGKWQDPEEEGLKFFDNYVHDSRAWFKLSGPDSEDKMLEELQKWIRRRKDVEIRKKWVGRGVPPQLSDGLTPEQRIAADEYMKTGKIPRILNGGREPFKWCQAGYLRYRRVYGGWDSVYLS